LNSMIYFPERESIGVRAGISHPYSDNKRSCAYRGDSACMRLAGSYGPGVLNYEMSSGGLFVSPVKCDQTCLLIILPRYIPPWRRQASCKGCLAFPLRHDEGLLIVLGGVLKLCGLHDCIPIGLLILYAQPLNHGFPGGRHRSPPARNHTP
jgi:hypothetical protein